jgi:protein-S-isoprenylcysteine O-methyltransferase Ste14
VWYDRVVEVLETIVVALVLHGVFSVTVPYAILAGTDELAWTQIGLGPVRWAGVAVVAFGIYLYIWSLVALLRSKTSAIPGQKASHLRTDSWYGRVRHPLLLGVVLILYGEAITFDSWALVAYATLYWGWLTLFVARKEEPELREVFGEAYDAYCEKVPRWIPRLRKR